MGDDNKSSTPNAAQPQGAPDPGAALVLDLRSQLEASNGKLLQAQETIKQLNEAAANVNAMNVSRSSELADARALANQQTAKVDELSAQVLKLTEENTKLQKQVEQLNTVIAGAGASALPTLPRGTVQLCESATISIVQNGKLVAANANKDDVLYVGDEKDLGVNAVKYGEGGRRRVFVVQKQMVDELKQLGLLYPNTTN